MDFKQQRGMQFEVKAWSECIDMKQFRALSYGIGMGRLCPPDPHVFHRTATSSHMQPKTVSRPESKQNDSSRPSAKPASLDDHADHFADDVLFDLPFAITNANSKTVKEHTQTGVKQEVDDYANRPSREASNSIFVRLLRNLGIHLIDLAFVTMSLSAALFVVLWFLGSDVSETELKGLIPFSFDAYMTASMCLLGIYVTYLFYWFLFRLLGGSTIGQHFLGHSAKISLETKPSSVTQVVPEFEMF